jgi:hypothetical protein
MKEIKSWVEFKTIRYTTNKRISQIIKNINLILRP